MYFMRAEHFGLAHFESTFYSSVSLNSSGLHHVVTAITKHCVRRHFAQTRMVGCSC